MIFLEKKKKTKKKTHYNSAAEGVQVFGKRSWSKAYLSVVVVVVVIEVNEREFFQRSSVYHGSAMREKGERSESTFLAIFSKFFFFFLKNSSFSSHRRRRLAKKLAHTHPHDDDDECKRREIESRRYCARTKKGVGRTKVATLVDFTRRRRLFHLLVSTRTKRTNRILFAFVLLSMVFDWSRVETKCPMCKQRFYWIEREAKEKKEKEKNDGEGDDDDDDDNNSSITSGINDIKNNQREKPTYCPLKNQKGNQEEEDEDLDPRSTSYTVCQSGDDERNLLL